MNDDDKQNPDLAVETTYFPPSGPGTSTDSSDQPPETVARVADSTLHSAPAQAAESTAVDSQVATIDLPPSAAPAGSTTSPTIDWTDAGRSQKSAPKSKPVESPGRRQIGEYDIIGELGRGGMGVVYQARHRQLGRVVALKMIRAGVHADADDLDRFLSEAQAVARLQHPGIVQIFDIGQQDGLPYFSLEFVEGRSLLARIAKEPLEPREAAALVEQIARAMQYAHDQGILHRDLKPANVLLTAEGKPKITDFGLAKHLEEGASASTQTGSIMGTPSYMSPEQASGISKELTPATDQYSLGALLYHLLTGRPPFLAAKPVETVLQVLHDEPVPPRQLQPTVPVDLETICLKALQKDSQRRYASCDELAADLRRYLSGEPIVARPVSLPERLWRWCRRNPRTAIPTAASILLFLIAFGISAGSAWALAALNADLKTETTKAKTQERIAKQKAKEATEAKVLADERADIALNTISNALTTINTGFKSENPLHTLRQQLGELTVRDLSKLESMMSSSGITERATTLSYHKMMYELYRDSGQTKNAWDHMSKAHAIARQRIKDQDGSTASRYNLAIICLDMAAVSQVINRDMQVAQKYANESATLLEDVLANPKPGKKDPGQIDIIEWLSDAYSTVAVLHVRLGSPSNALRNFEKSQSTREGVFKNGEFKSLGDVARRQRELELTKKSALTVMGIADMHFRLDHADDARTFYAKAIAIHEDQAQQYPNNLDLRFRLANACNQAGYVHLVRGDMEEADRLLSRAIKLYTELSRLVQNNVDVYQRFAIAHLRAGILKQLQKDDAAEAHFAECLKIRTALAKDTENVSRQRELLVALARASKHQEAAALAEKLLMTVKPPDIELLLDVARAYAQCSVAVAGDEAAAEAFRVKAVDAISQAVKQGHKDKVYLATEPDFMPIRERDDFKALAAAETK
jgi:serine/threonine-protein kinase